MEVESLIKSNSLEFVAMVRYVDDIHFFFKRKDGLLNIGIYKELSNIEHRISKWLYKNLGLSLNEQKTLRKIILDRKQKRQFVENTKKKTYGSQSKSLTISDINKKINLFTEAIKKFAYPDTLTFDNNLIKSKEKEDLKYIFDKSVKNKLAQILEVKKMIKVLNSIDIELSADQFNILGALFEVGSKDKKPYGSILDDYFGKNFNPSDKRHIHIMLIASSVLSNKKSFKNIVDRYKVELMKDDYGKYLVSYFFSVKKNKLDATKYWEINTRVFERICLEKSEKCKNFPFITKSFCPHPFKVIFFLDNNNLDSIYTALGGYIHEFRFRRWSVAFNKLQMIAHESIKYSFKEIKEGDKGKDIIRKVIKGGLLISTYEERDFLNFWERRNFNPVSHGSKNGLTSPEVTYEELIGWEEKISNLINKILSTKNK
ncbi:MAG: hypothetical protein ACOX0B_01205 [Minisyncoccales bacterium]|jgi:hypothetical protein